MPQRMPLMCIIVGIQVYNDRGNTMASRWRWGKFQLFLVMVFCILSIHQISAQIKIKERVYIAPQKKSTDFIVKNTNNNGWASLVISIAAVESGPSGAVISFKRPLKN
jgi:hypothetical protein